MKWALELLDRDKVPFLYIGIVNFYATEAAAHEAGEWFREIDATVGGFLVTQTVTNL